MKKIISIFLIFLVVACSKEQEQKPTTPLIVNTSNGEIRFNVEVANTPQELQTGLMNRSQLPLNNGMIFNIYPVRPTAMWMKNTKISLDMIFVAPDGSISMIKEHTTPMSEDLIISRDPVRAVIELNAGQVSRHGIKIGDKINHAMFNNITTLSDTPTIEIQPSAIMPKGPNAANGPIIPKGPNAVNGPIIPKGPNAPAAEGQVVPKGPFAPNTDPNAPVIPKGPNAPAAEGQVVPKGPFAPNTDPNAPVIPKGPNAPAQGPVPIPAP